MKYFTYDYQYDLPTVIVKELFEKLSKKEQHKFALDIISGIKADIKNHWEELGYDVEFIEPSMEYQVILDVFRENSLLLLPLIRYNIKKSNS